VGIDPGMALTPLPSSIGWGLKSRPSDLEPSALPLDHSFRFIDTSLLWFMSVETNIITSKTQSNAENAFVIGMWQLNFDEK